MPTATLTYDYGRYNDENGWPSRYSFSPEMMVGLNNNLYSFKNGDIYVHDSDNVDRCEFYGVKYPCTITTEFNVNPLDKKVFETIHIDSDVAWDADLDTDLSIGRIEAASFEKKEGDFFAYVRQLDNLTIDAENALLLSTQGVGEVSTFVSQVITFTSNIDSTAFAVGDRIFRVVGSGFVYVGNITAYGINTITVSGPASTPVAGNFIVVGKNRIAESRALRGYYLSCTLTTNEDGPVELFAVSSAIFKSFP
jgi:hypothetical protein